ncbi:MAG: ABC-type amino acid transport/signal transduction systems, periplasmic component/domain [uncultured Paraburkholderia sp.]|uniref:ABC transporter substrate-binding protein n=1 Tax=Paraburkholderia strydomiana TaxID=1245417 RepID=UPI00259A6339|nr:ABC transporter substrate-binding protein [uncultured Paraburkholderia sp.]CAH2897043.1 MAG: ABC-type amino acid transport/signal transduction systems, periplasmic component/domain [uncultured Paraburkholderia sp.]CAH2920840.1 MAG: ABC-type amino acid transport/signal transduction systems, periplasmic component/domain [uncultured Paraburkholderia sp.]
MSMSKAFKLLLCAVTSLLLAQGASAQSCEPSKVAQKYPSLAGKTIKIGVDPESPPYAFRDSKDFNKIIGADADMARAVFDCAGVKTEFFTAGWPGLLPALRAGQIDVMWDLLYYTPERAKETTFVTYMQAGTGGLVAAGNPKKIDDIAKLCGLTVTAGIGTVELTMAQAQAAKCKAEGKPDVTIMTSADIASGARLVASHRADVMMYDLALVDGLAKQNPQLYTRGFMVTSGMKIGVGVKKGNADMIAAVSDGLRIMQANQTQKKTFQHYGVDPSLEMPSTLLTQ